MKLVMLGGTFNPPHLGHLKIAEAVKEAFGYDLLVLVPSYKPAHKEISGEVSFHHRRNMVELAFAGMEGVVVSSCEYDRKGTSYSIDTIRTLIDEYTPQGKPGLVIGDDLIQGFAQWHRADELSREADIIICHRGREEDLIFPYAHRYLENPVFEASSTDIRHILAAGGRTAHLLPPAVEGYIQREGLYGTD